MPGTPPAQAAELLAGIDGAVETALAVLRQTPEAALLQFRGVGKAQRPSDVLGLLAHAGQHAQRHAGQVITTVRILRGAEPHAR